MQGWLEYPLAAGVVARVVGEMKDLPPALEAEVERAWQAARAAVPSLFNGRVLSVETIAPDRLFCRWTEYRRVAAQLREPGLHERLRIRPMAVCGPLLCADGVVLGRREAGSVYLPGYWQLPPAGNVDVAAVQGDAIDLEAALIQELEEELGLDADKVASLHPVCAVEHPGTHVVDIACRMETGLDAAAIHAAHARAPDREIDLLRIVPRDGLAGALRECTPMIGVVPRALRAMGML